MKANHKTTEVFGVGRDLPLNYVKREKVDKPFSANLRQDKHVVVFGSSKQGKTSLRKNELDEKDCVTVSCLNTMSLQELHGAILKGLGYRIEVGTSRSQGGTLKVIAKFSGKGKIPFVAEAGAEGGGEKEWQKESQVETKPLELELSDVNDVIAAIEQVSFDGYIILEDFHYLPVETQRNFCFALKSFHESSRVCFIVIGVWRDRGRLEYYNGDLTGRVTSIDADEWSESELIEVIENGEALLNVEFDQDFKINLVRLSHDAVHLVQEACLYVCLDAGVEDTQEQCRKVGTGVNASALIERIVEGQAGRYIAFLSNFAEGFQKTELAMYKWLIKSVISSSVDDLERGLRRGEVSARVKAIHPEGDSLNEGNITQALQNTASLQILKSVRPIVLDYDQTTRVLHVVDKAFLIWLSHQDISELLDELGA